MNEDYQRLQAAVAEQQARVRAEMAKGRAVTTGEVQQLHADVERIAARQRGDRNASLAFGAGFGVALGAVAYVLLGWWAIAGLVVGFAWTFIRQSTAADRLR